MRPLYDILAQLVEGLPFPMTIGEVGREDEHFQLVNRAFTQTFGYELADIPDRQTWAQKAYPDAAYRLKVFEGWDQELATACTSQGTLAAREIEITTRDDRVLQVLVGGMVIGKNLVLIFVDISSQREAEAQLSNVRFQLERTAYELTENLPVGTYTMVQPPDGGMAQFRFMSTKFLELTGLTRERAYADPLQGFACVHPQDYDAWVELNAKAFANREAFSGETRVVVEGVTRWITAESKPRALPDGSTVWEGVLTDITERKQAEIALARAKAHAEKLERLKSDFLTQMSHEIRTPLTAILGLADLLARDPLQPMQQDKVQQIQSSGKLLLGIINDILDLSKIEANQLITEERPFQFDDLLDSVKAHRASIISPEVSLSISSPNHELPPLIGDRRRIEQVLGNLVSNAIKFTQRGEITVTLSAERINESMVVLRARVQDTGTGIEHAFLPKLFTPFAQADSGIARKYGGTGLGLSISKQLIELMGGEIGAQSQPGVGSTFWFDLPLSVSQQPARAHRPIAPKLGKNRLAELHILAVDDSASIRDLIHEFLELEGAHVELAQDGAQALAILKDRGTSFDCVMMDVQMPVMDGLTATQQIHAMREFENLPILAMTAGLLAEQQARARQAGMADVIAKPVDVDRMIVQILSAVGRHSSAELDSAASQNPMPVIAGIDRDSAKVNMDGNRHLFDRLLVVFVQEFDGLDERIATLLSHNMDAATIREARRLAHALCGGASQIGANELSVAAAALERALQTEAPQAMAKCQAMSKLLADLMRSLKQYLSKHKAVQVTKR